MTKDSTDFIAIAVIAWGVISWLTHIVVCIQQAKYILLLVGAFVFPVGCIHGTGVWLGIF
jgi:hypothetical protein